MSSNFLLKLFVLEEFHKYNKVDMDKCDTKFKNYNLINDISNILEDSCSHCQNYV